ncbi:MFS transporter [Izhakiella australiensis]|uniref:MFS transporter n=1 Tax=Izhakiella australiensis TaxID=1926881 RepID=A0A1S8YR64_9GAMM|nr:MFS transporter [Izhakiella australiensis]OON41639.1 MFS transporter [Izhakiella australiensis]
MAESKPSSSAAGAKSNVRRFIVFMLFITVVINYVDRSSLSIAAPHIVDELGLSSVQMGFIFSAFAWAYSPLQIPGSFLVDKVAPKVLYPIIIGAWSLFTFMQGTAGSMWQLIIFRLGVGASEVPSYPMNNRIITTWLPEKERATAVGIYISGQYVGLAFLAPVLVWLQSEFGWRFMFYTTGGISILWALGFWILYKDPMKSRANAEEIDYIRQGGGRPEWLKKQHDPQSAQTDVVPFSRLAKSRKLWGLVIAHMGETCANWFFLTWFPIYLVKYRHIEFIKVGFMATLPFAAAWCGVLLSGYISDKLLKKGFSLTFSRKAPIITGLLLATTIIGANYVDSPTLIVVFMSVAFFGSGLAAISWSVVSSIAPVNLTGITGGIFNFVGTSMGILVPILIGFLVSDGNFSPALIFVGCMALLSIFSWTVIMGKIERVQ